MIWFSSGSSVARDLILDLRNRRLESGRDDDEKLDKLATEMKLLNMKKLKRKRRREKGKEEDGGEKGTKRRPPASERGSTWTLSPDATSRGTDRSRELTDR
jgi:hypothetical protein